MRKIILKILETKMINSEQLKAEIEQFKTEAMKMHVVQVWAESYKNSDPFGYVITEAIGVFWVKEQARQLWQFWQSTKEQNAEIEALKAKLAKYENKRFFSHDFNGDGFQYHDTLEEAKKEAEAGLDWYRDRVAGGHHVEDDGEFKELCFGVVLASADYNVDEVVTKEHHMNDEWTQYEVGTEILSLDFYEEPVKPSQENSHD